MKNLIEKYSIKYPYHFEDPKDFSKLTSEAASQILKGDTYFAGEKLCMIEYSKYLLENKDEITYKKFIQDYLEEMLLNHGDKNIIKEYVKEFNRLRN